MLPRADEDQFQTEARRDLLSRGPADRMLVVREELLRRQPDTTPVVRSDQGKRETALDTGLIQIAL